MTTERKWTRSLFALALLAVFVSAGALLAGKPGGGGGKPPKDEQLPPGRIYFGTGGTDAEGNAISVYGSMLADGSDKQLSERGHPSYLLHNRDRWFLDVLTICLEQDAEENCTKYTAGVFAVRETDGLEVQLTNDPVPRLRVRWGKDDSFISFVGRHDADADGVSEDSIFVADVAFDEEGKPCLTETPVAVATFDLDDHLGSFDWSPDGTKVVYMLGKKLTATDPAPMLIVADFNDPRTVLPLDFGYGPEWSPDGSKIAYRTADGVIATIDPDGNNYLELTTPSGRSFPDEYPRWSPDSGHIAFNRWTISNKGGQSTFFHNILRVPATGGKMKNLTDDIGNAWAFGWRKEEEAGL